MDIIEVSNFFIASRISSFAKISISALTPSLSCPKIAPDVDSYCRVRRTCSESPHLLIAKLKANKRSEIFIEELKIPLLKRILLSTGSRPFFGASAFFRPFFFLTTVHLSNLLDCSETKLFSLAISINVF